ncbi:MAG: RNA polymerase sigma factor [Cellvibrionaceae bacterium]
MAHSSFQSLAQVLETCYEELRQFIRLRTGSAAMAEEVVQETWIRANAAAVELPNNPRAYLYRMAGNLAIDQIRRERARGRWIHSQADNDDPIGLADVPCPAPDPLDILISHQELAILKAAVDELPNKCREVFLRYRGQGLTMGEVAGQLGVSEKTVEKHIARAMIHCRQRLREAGRNV